MSLYLNGAAGRAVSTQPIDTHHLCNSCHHHTSLSDPCSCDRAVYANDLERFEEDELERLHEHNPFEGFL